MAKITLENIGEVVTYHAPDAEQLEHYAEIRFAASNFIQVILLNTPECADQTAAIRKVREAMMTANAAIALRGLV